MAEIVPREVLDFFRKKKLRPSFDYRDTWREEHAYSFTVAKAMQQDILEDIKQGIDDAIANGTTLQQFQKDLRPLLQKKGWWGIRQMADPKTGEIIDVQLGSPRRLKTIYDANMRSARAAGQWERAQRTKKALPYFVYLLGPSIKHRKEHESWKGIILPIDHTFWKTHFAPNGWGCKCHIRQISQREADRLLAKGGYTTEAPPIKYIDWENKRTGEVEQIPEGIDPGWNTNPGWLREANLDRDFLRKAQSAGNLEFATDTIFSPVRVLQFQMWVNAMFRTDRPGGDLRTVAVIGEDEINHLADNDVQLSEILTVVEGRLMAKPGKHKPSKTKRHREAGNALTKKQWQKLPELMPEASMILWHKKTRQLIYILKDGEDVIKVAIQTNYKSRRAVKAGLEEKINQVQTAFKINARDIGSLAGDANIDIIRDKK